MDIKKIAPDTPYKGCDDGLLYLHEQATKMLFEINSAPPEKRGYLHEHIFPQLFAKLGKNTWFETPFNCDYGKYIEIGENCFFNHHCSIGDRGQVKIGSHVIIGPYVGIYTSQHPLDAETRKAGWQTVQDIEIGDNVWIGANVTILSGVKIGKNAVIGAGSVVTKDIPDNVLVCGVPCKIVKQI